MAERKSLFELEKEFELYLMTLPKEKIRMIREFISRHVDEEIEICLSFGGHGA